LADGHQVWALSRDPHRKRFLPGVTAVAWDGKTSAGWGWLASEVDAIVNLAGATVGRWPWTENRRRGFVSSRVNPGAAITEAIREANPRPQVLLQASGGGYYGPHGDEPVTEETPPGNDFSARICLEWEASSSLVEELGVRRVVTRSGIVIARDAQILQLMALPTRLFLGGRFGDGRQGVGWIHLQDEVRAFRFLIESPDARGPYNLSAPHPVSNADFMRSLARTLHRPYWFHVPAILLRTMLGEMSTLVLEGWFLRPRRLPGAGFAFNLRTLMLPWPISAII
jgi:uncharacterized protein (TIGR01777 family)